MIPYVILFYLLLEKLKCGIKRIIRWFLGIFLFLNQYDDLNKEQMFVLNGKFLKCRKKVKERIANFAIKMTDYY